ncbi:tetratricopeptide repeat protein [uncultured Devosia sp.]|uniref:tetratricopeptide repeat protein n=1 Tax=uncultured Devosia sp. TaxID=211434 RepID=UPI0035CA6E56
MRIWTARLPVVIAAWAGPLLALLLLLGPAAAQPANPALDTLFAQLRLAPDADAAKLIDRQIWALWMTPADPDLAGRMRRALVRLSLDPPAAIADLEAIVKDHPEYAEAWNQLATIHFMMGDYQTSLAEIDKVLQFEPRHFGALAGRALIYRSQGRQALALKDIAAALALHPFLSERALFPQLLDDVTRI